MLGGTGPISDMRKLVYTALRSIDHVEAGHCDAEYLRDFGLLLDCWTLPVFLA